MQPDVLTFNYIQRLGYDPADITKGCAECLPANVPWTAQHSANAVRVALGVYILRHWVATMAGKTGPAGSIRGWWRCASCNTRRDGAPASKHIAGGAIDTDFDRAERAAFGRLLDIFGAPRIVSMLGSYVGCAHPGMIRYPSGAVHLDTIVVEAAGVGPRSRTFIDLQ